MSYLLVGGPMDGRRLELPEPTPITVDVATVKPTPIRPPEHLEDYQPLDLTMSYYDRVEGTNTYRYRETP